MMQQQQPENFLPKVEVTTMVWVCPGISEDVKWWAAQGDDLKRGCPTIEINFPRILLEVTPEQVAESMIQVWLDIYIVLATRQALIDRGVRWAVSEKGHQALYKGNLKAIKASPLLREEYTRVAVGALTNGKHVASEGVSDLVEALKRVIQEMDAQLALMEATQVIQTAAAQNWLQNRGTPP